MEKVFYHDGHKAGPEEELRGRWEERKAFSAREMVFGCTNIAFGKTILSILIPDHAISKNFKELVRFFHWKIKTDYCMEVSFK